MAHSGSRTRECNGRADERIGFHGRAPNVDPEVVRTPSSAWTTIKVTTAMSPKRLLAASCPDKRQVHLAANPRK
jgi:hypothetical protein